MSLEKRIEALEKEVADLKEQLIILRNAISCSVIQLKTVISTADKQNN